MREPRDPLLKVVLCIKFHFLLNNYTGVCVVATRKAHKIHFFCKAVLTTRGKPSEKVYARGAQIDGEMKNDRACTVKEKTSDNSSCYFNNDPSAGSPTETLLRLLLPLNDQV